MQQAERNYNLKQKQLICLGFIAQQESVTASELIRHLSLKDADALRPWLQRLIDLGLVESTKERSKAKEYRVNAQLLIDSNYKGRTSLKRIEPYRLRELIVEDLKIYKSATLGDLQERIGQEIPYKKVWQQLQGLVDEGRVRRAGTNRWTRYELIE